MHQLYRDWLYLAWNGLDCLDLAWFGFNSHGFSCLALVLAWLWFALLGSARLVMDWLNVSWRNMARRGQDYCVIVFLSSFQTLCCAGNEILRNYYE